MKLTKAGLVSRHGQHLIRIPQSKHANIIQRVDAGEKRMAIAADLGVSPSTVSRIYKKGRSTNGNG